MEPPFLTIADAAKVSGRSQSTIRRLIKTIADAPSHPDRGCVEPARKAVEAFKKKGQNFTWMIREDVLMRNFPPALIDEKKTLSHSSSPVHEDVMALLRRELDLKNRQIEKQWDVINALNERLREGNILMGSLQQRLALPRGESSAPVSTSGPSMEASMDTLHRASKKKVLEVKKKLSQKQAAKSPKRGVFGWLFR